MAFDNSDKKNYDIVSGSLKNSNVGNQQLTDGVHSRIDSGFNNVINLVTQNLNGQSKFEQIQNSMDINMLNLRN